MKDIGKYVQENRWKINAILTIVGTIGLILTLGAVLFVLALWIWGHWHDASSSVFNMFAFTVGYLAALYFLTKQGRKFIVFCKIDVDVPAMPNYMPDMAKHTPKVMLYSLIKYLAVVFALAAVPYGIFVVPLLPVYFVVIRCTGHYIKLWKHHGYSVLLLLGLTGVTIIAAAMLAPFVRAGLWTIVDMLLRIF